MSHRGVRPTGQPRTLRSVAEDKGAPANREAPPTMSPDKSHPAGAMPMVGGAYHDEAEEAARGQQLGARPAEPSPLSLKGAAK